jgi:Carbamoyl-phosphate synthetase large chain, oligomerisation domain
VDKVIHISHKFIALRSRQPPFSDLAARRDFAKVVPAQRRTDFFIRHALRAGFSVDEIFNLTKIDRWFLAQIKEIVDFEEELAGTKN